MTGDQTRDPATVYKLFFHPGEVVELRALGLQGRGPWEGYPGGSAGIVAGFYSTAESLAEAADKLERQAKKPKGIYFTLNPVNPQLMARACARLVGTGKGLALTKDENVLCLRWLPIDFDPKKPSGISANQAELDLAADKAREVSVFLEGELGFPAGIRAFSGNGYHLLYRLPDLENTKGNRALVKACLDALVHRFSPKPKDENEPEPLVKVDPTLSNPGQILKLYGTWARKGDPWEDRIHRQSHLYKGQPEKLDDVPVTPLETLKKLAELAPVAPPPPARGGQRPVGGKRGKSLPQGGNLGPLDVPGYLAHYGVRVKTTKEKGGAVLHILEECVFDPNHRGEASIVQQPDGMLSYQCFHDSCSGFKWKDARRAISGDDSVAPFCAGYDPDWSPPPSVEGPARLATDVVATDLVVTGVPGVPPPAEIDPTDEFFESKGKGKRGTYKEFRMANYLSRWLHPLVHTDNVFWRFTGGVWKPISRYTLRQIMVQAMGDTVKDNYLNSTLGVLAGLVNREEADWPHHPELVNCKNGMLDLLRVSQGHRAPELVLLDHDPKYGSRTQIPVAYNHKAEYALWDKTLGQIYEEDGNKIGVLQFYCGYILMDHCRYERALFLYGGGANGKSTILNVLEDVIGREHISGVSIQDLANKFSIPSLQHKLLNVASEIETREAAGTENFKKAISGDLLSGERKHGERVEFRSRVKFIFAMNAPPAVADRSEGFRRKVIILQHQRRFQEHEMDRDLSRKLREEREGIFKWMVQGAGMLMAEGGFIVEGTVAEDSAKFMETVNPLLLFLSERCERDREAKIPREELYQAYCAWCDSSKARALGKTRFYDAIRSTWTELTEDRAYCDNGGRRHCFFGIKLMSS